MRKALNAKTTHYIKEHRILLINALGGCCEKCGSPEKLQIHHKRYIEELGLNDVEILCFECHKKWHGKKYYIKFKTKKIEFETIISKIEEDKIINIPDRFVKFKPGYRVMIKLLEGLE